MDDLKVGDEIEWKEWTGEVRQGTVLEIFDNDWTVYVKFFRGNFNDYAEVGLNRITKINGVKV